MAATTTTMLRNLKIIFHVNHELTMTSQIKWLPIRTNGCDMLYTMRECAVVVFVVVVDVDVGRTVLGKTILPLIVVQSNKRDDSHTNTN